MDAERHILERRGAWPAVLAGITAFSFSAPLYKLSGAPPAVGSALRFAYGAVFLALLAWRAGALRPGPGFAPAAAAGALVGLEVVIWNEATGRIGAGPSTVIVNTASLWVMAADGRRAAPAGRVAAGRRCRSRDLRTRAAARHRRAPPRARRDRARDRCGCALRRLHPGLRARGQLGPRRHLARALEHRRRGAGLFGVRHRARRVVGPRRRPARVARAARRRRPGLRLAADRAQPLVVQRRRGVGPAPAPARAGGRLGRRVPERDA